MLARPFDWRDLPYLHALRAESLFLDHGLLLTRGALQVVGAMLSNVLPGAGMFTGVVQHEKHPRLRLIGQVVYHTQTDAASLSFLTPQRLVRREWLLPLIRLLAHQAVAHHALRLLAETDNQGPALATLLECGFKPYGQQCIWKLPPNAPSRGRHGGHWRMAQATDVPAIQRLYRRIAPARVQQVTPVLPEATSGLVFARGETILGFIALRYGLSGVLAQPFLQPEMSAATVENALALLYDSPITRGRPLYVCVRADQQWLDSLLLDLGASASAEHTLLVKPLTASPLRKPDTGTLSLAHRSGLLPL